MSKKLVSILIPTYNEEANVIPLHDALVNRFKADLPNYDYEIMFIDNKSTDGTRTLLRQLCLNDQHVKVIFNMKNFGQFNSPYYGLCQTTGDCTVLLCADFQDPIEVIPDMVHRWEEGNQVICMIKNHSEENRLIYWVRGCYYKLLRRMSDIQQMPQFTGFGLYDRSFIDVMRNVNEHMPFFRGMVAEYAPIHLEMTYTQPKRRAGKTKNNFYSLYDAAMLSFTNYTKAGLRIVTFGGFMIAGLSFLVALIYLILKLCNWYNFNAGTAPMILGIFLMGGLQLAALGFIGEYILSINQRVMNKPIVIEEERINFKTSDSIETK
ncbi:MAG: glycosyltransferase family 2 protein [Eubacteriales bacterium]|nr:glycosyltransferase family 2 protein [Eubacteriales bacterium]